MRPTPEPLRLHNGRIGDGVAQQLAHVSEKVGALLLERCGPVTDEHYTYPIAQPCSNARSAASKVVAALSKLASSDCYSIPYPARYHLRHSCAASFLLHGRPNLRLCDPDFFCISTRRDGLSYICGATFPLSRRAVCIASILDILRMKTGVG